MIINYNFNIKNKHSSVFFVNYILLTLKIYKMGDNFKNNRYEGIAMLFVLFIAFLIYISF